jgi:hypothetical protein
LQNRNSRAQFADTHECTVEFVATLGLHAFAADPPRT